MSNARKLPKNASGKRGTGDRDIEVGQADQVAYWTKRLGIPKWRLNELIKAAGKNPADVMRQMEREKVETALKHILLNEEADKNIDRAIQMTKRDPT